HDLVVAAGGWAQDEFRDAGGDVIGDAGDDRLAVADREVVLGLAAGALPVGREQRGEGGVVGRAEAEGDAGAVMVVVDRAAYFGRGGADRGDDAPRLLGRLGAGLPAGAEPRGAPDRRLGRAADPHRQVGLHRLWRQG